MTTRVLVVGAGLVGLTCGVRLAEDGYDVHVLARDLPLETTSAVAGALWLPYRVGTSPEVARWAARTREVLTCLAERPGAGVELRPGVLLERTAGPAPVWAAEVPGQPGPPLVHAPDPAPGYRHGWAATLPMVDPTRYLPALAGRLAAAGGTLTRMPLAALPQRGLVVNATGVSARAMAGDDSVQPVRGQVVLLANPGLTRWLVDLHEENGLLRYVLPHTDTVVVGGTAQEGDWNPRPDPATARALVEAAIELVPALASAPVLGHRVGLRPARPSVRLETEQRHDGAVVHCYGHGGSGLTLSWGCADDVLEQVRQLA